jgi:uncharacterized membrane protein
MSTLNLLEKSMELVQHRHHPTQNVHEAERFASILAGTSLAYIGMRQTLKYHSVPGVGLVLAGAALIRRGITGYCDLYHVMGVRTAQGQQGTNATIAYQQGIRIDRSITINAGREQVYSFWRNLENLPRFMKHVLSVKQTDDRHSHWAIEGPAGHRIEWDAEIINDVPNELLAWRSLPGAWANNAGSVRFEHATAGRGTKVTVSLKYELPAGQVGAMVAKLFGSDPEQTVDAELHRLKNIVEAGEIPTSAGQPSGRADDQAEHASHRLKQEKVHDASEASFPASDPPSYSHVNGR